MRKYLTAISTIFATLAAPAPHTRLAVASLDLR